MNVIDSKIAELASRFAGRADKEREALAQAFVAGDRIALRDRAHKLAGVSAMFGFDEIGNAAFALEEAADSGASLEEPYARLDRALREIS